MTARTQTILKHLGLVDKIARSVHRKIAYTVDFDDLVQAGREGLIDGVDKYEDRSDVQPSTYLGYRIRGAIYDFLRNNGTMSRGSWARRRQLLAIHEKYNNTHGRDATLEEVAQETGLEGDKLDEFMLQGGIYIISLDTPWTDTSMDASGGITLEDMIPASGPGTDQLVFDTQISEYLQQILFLLSKRERQIVEMYYYDGMSMRDIGKTFGITESRVSQVHGKVINRLRKMINVEKLVG